MKAPNSSLKVNEHNKISENSIFVKNTYGYMKRKISFLLPATVSLLVYMNGLHGEFVHDDVFAIKNNKDVLGVTPFSEVFLNDFWGKSMWDNTSHKSYRPLTVLTFRLNYAFNGLNPFYFHIVNVLLHCLVTSLFITTCKQVLLVSENCSLVAGLLFATHPIHTEAVTGLVGRADLLSAVFFLLSMISYERSIKVHRNGCSLIQMCTLYLLCMFSVTAATLCKENGITVVGVFVLYNVILICSKVQRQRQNKNKTDLKQLFLRILIWSIFTLALLLFRLWVMNGTLPRFTSRDNPVSFHHSRLTRTLTYSHIWVYNIWLLINPAKLCYDWQHGSIPLVESAFDIRNVATAAVAAGFAVYTYRSIVAIKTKNGVGKRSSELMALVLTVLPFMPATNLFFIVGFVLAERVLYIPSFGFCLCVAIGFCKMHSHWNQHRHVLKAALCFLLLVNYGKIWQQNKTWNSRESLFSSGVNTMPHNAKVHYNYANFLKDTGNPSKAIFHYTEALRLDNDYASAHNNLGTLLKDKVEAETHFREALRIQPNHQSAHVNLGTILFKRGNKEEGMQLLYDALEIEDRNIETLTLLAWCLIETGRFLQAESYLKTATEINPLYYEAYVSYGALMSKTGRHEKAVEYYTKAHQVDPSQSVPLSRAAYSFQNLGNFDEAEQLLKRAISITKDNSIIEQLALLYYTTARIEESIALYENIVTDSGTSADTIVRYANLLAARGNFKKSEDLLSRVTGINESNMEVLETLAKVKSSLQKYDEAVELLSQAIHLSKNATELENMYFYRGDNYKYMKDYRKALTDFEATLTFNRNHASAHGNIGTIHHINGDYKRAQYHYSRALEIDPDNAVIKNNLEKLKRIQIPMIQESRDIP